MTSLRRFVPVSLLAAAVVLLPQAALAHDELISSDPADGTTVQDGPDELTLTFSGQIAEVGAAVAVTDGAGTSVVDDEPQVEGTTVVQDLADDLAAGDYEVVWRVTSQDGHPISGTFGFVVEADASADEPSEDTTDGGSQDATDEATQDATEDAADSATTDPADDATDGADETPAQDDASTVGEASGMPVWVWVVVGLGVAGLVALLARTWSRNRA